MARERGDECTRVLSRSPLNSSKVYISFLSICVCVQTLFKHCCDALSVRPDRQWCALKGGQLPGNYLHTVHYHKCQQRDQWTLRADNASNLELLTWHFWASDLRKKESSSRLSDLLLEWWFSEQVNVCSTGLSKLKIQVISTPSDCR